MKTFTMATVALVLAACHQPSPAEIAKAQADQRAADQAAAAQQATDSARVKAEAEAATAKQAADGRAAHDRLRSSVKDRLQEVYATAKPCDDAGVEVSHAATAGDRQLMYEAAASAKSVCQQVSFDVDKLKPPEGVEGDAKAAFSKAFDDLGTAEFARSDAYGNMAKAIDSGDIRPSVIADLKQSMQVYQSGLFAGLAEYLKAASDVGVKLDELETKSTS